MTDASVEIDDRHELLALHKMLVHAKFWPDDLDEFRGSPFIAAIQRRIAEALVLRGDLWDARIDEIPPAIEAVRSRIHRAATWWRSASTDDRRQYVLDLVAPYGISDEMLDRLVNAEID